MCAAGEKRGGNEAAHVSNESRAAVTKGDIDETTQVAIWLNGQWHGYLIM